MNFLHTQILKYTFIKKIPETKQNARKKNIPDVESSWMTIKLLSFSKEQVLHSELIKIRRNWMLLARGGCI